MAATVRLELQATVSVLLAVFSVRDYLPTLDTEGT